MSPVAERVSSESILINTYHGPTKYLMGRDTYICSVSFQLYNTLS